MPDTLLKSILYRKERVGVVQKDGRAYVKYTRTPRLKISKNTRNILFALAILLVFGLGVVVVWNELCPPEAAGTAAGIEG